MGALGLRAVGLGGRRQTCKQFNRIPGCELEGWGNPGPGRGCDLLGPGLRSLVSLPTRLPSRTGSAVPKRDSGPAEPAVPRACAEAFLLVVGIARAPPPPFPALFTENLQCIQHVQRLSGRSWDRPQQPPGDHPSLPFASLEQ